MVVVLRWLRLVTPIVRSTTHGVRGSSTCSHVVSSPIRVAWKFIIQRCFPLPVSFSESFAVSMLWDVGGFVLHLVGSIFVVGRNFYSQDSLLERTEVAYPSAQRMSALIQYTVSVSVNVYTHFD